MNDPPLLQHAQGAFPAHGTKTGREFRIAIFGAMIREILPFVDAINARNAREKFKRLRAFSGLREGEGRKQARMVVPTSDNMRMKCLCSCRDIVIY
jgi:hypothetical protein